MIDYPAEDFPVFADVTVAENSHGKRVAILTLTNRDDRRPATMGPLGLERLSAALDDIHASATDYAAVIITGNGRTFCAGANLDTLSSPRDLEAALALAREGHRVFSQIADLPIPTIAAINGTALGGGLELALHCTYRIAQEGAGPLGLPEIGLGLIPGWGGATVLPRLIGLDRALTVIVDNAVAGKTLTAAAALELGVVDAVVPDVMSGTLNFIDGLGEDWTRELTSPMADVAVSSIDTAIDRYVSRVGNPIGALEQLRTVLHGSLTADRATSYAAEDEALSTLMMTAEFRRRLYAFRVTSAANKPPIGTPDVAPRTIARVGVVGAGLMASQIAIAFAEHLAVPVVFSDVAQERLDAAMDRMDGWLSTRVAKGSLTDDGKTAILGRLVPTLSMADFATCDLVMEAVFEDLEVKRQVLTALEDVVSPTAILASNTSSLSINTMATFVENSERVAGIHFFNPVGVMKLVEVVRGSAESDEVLTTAIDVARKLRKTPVIVDDQAGFVVNRLLSTFLGESLRLVESGVPVNDVVVALAPLRLPMDPFALIDLIGRTVTLKMMESLLASAPERFYVGSALPSLTENAASNSIGADLTAHVTPTSHLDATTIHDTVVDALAREVRVMLDGGVVATPSDIDLCMINGAGWPAAIGGLTPYLDGSGASERATGKQIHPTAHFA